MKTLQEIKKAIYNAQNLFANAHKYGNQFYENEANEIWANGLAQLKKPSTDTFGGKLLAEFDGKKSHCPMSEKQAFWIALELCATNGIDMEVVKKYKH